MTVGLESEGVLLSVVIPAYNEEDNIRRGSLQEVAEYLSRQEYASELIIVDDGSEDATAALVVEAARRWPIVSLLAREHGGKAYAVAAGVLAARGEYVLFTDMDQSTPIRFVEEAVRQLQAGEDVVIGSRWLKGASRLGEPLLRSVMGWGFALLVRTLLLRDIRDSQCGFKAFRRKVAQELFGSMLVFGGDAPEGSGPMVTAFDVELLVLAKKGGYRLKEIPVTWRHVATRRVSPLKEAFRMAQQVMQVWLNKQRGRYRVGRG